MYQGRIKFKQVHMCENVVIRMHKLALYQWEPKIETIEVYRRAYVEQLIIAKISRYGILWFEFAISTNLPLCAS